MRCLLYPFKLVEGLQEARSAAPLVERFWQQVMEHPSSLAATAEALQACHTPQSVRFIDIIGFANVLGIHIAFMNSGDTWRYAAAWADILASDSLQQYAMEALADVADWRQPNIQLDMSPRSGNLELAGEPMQWFSAFLAWAAISGEVSEARLSTLITHESILAPLRVMAEGHGGLKGIHSSTLVLEAAWEHFGEMQRSPAGSPDVHGAAQRVILAALQQTAVLLQLGAMAPAQRYRAVRRARREGFLQVHPRYRLQSQQNACTF